MRMRLFLLLLLAPLASGADEGVHFSVAAGAGFAQALIGVQVQARVDQLAVFVGTGPFAFIGHSDGANGASYGGVAGARWYLGFGDRFFVSAQYMRVNFQTGIYQYNDFTGRYSWDHFNAVTIDLGWRTRWEHFFVDAGAGGGGVWYAGENAQATPDLTLALGWEF